MEKKSWARIAALPPVAAVPPLPSPPAPPTYVPAYVFHFPRDIWDSLLPFVPLCALGRLSRTCKFLRDKILSQHHWCQRLVSLGLFELFDGHAAKNAFTRADETDWRRYFMAYCFLDREIVPQRPLLLPDRQCTAEALISQAPQDPRLLAQFPPECRGQIVFATASEPWQRDWRQRRNQVGEQQGIFCTRDGTWFVYYWYYCIANDARYSKSLKFSAPTLPELMQALLTRAAEPRPRLQSVPMGARAWSRFLLEMLPMKNAWQFEFWHQVNSAHALTQYRAITVTFRAGNRMLEFVLTTLTVAPILAALSQAFAKELADCEPLTFVSLWPLEGSPTLSSKYTGDLRHGDRFRLLAEKKPERGRPPPKRGQP